MQTNSQDSKSLGFEEFKKGEIKGIVHRAGEEGYTKPEKLTVAKMKELVKISATSMSEEDKKKIKDFVENHKTVIF